MEQRIKASRLLKLTEKKGFNGRKKNVDVRNVEGGIKVKRITKPKVIKALAKSLLVNQSTNLPKNQAENNPMSVYKRN
jgi:hypothetical protein